MLIRGVRGEYVNFEHVTRAWFITSSNRYECVMEYELVNESGNIRSLIVSHSERERLDTKYSLIAILPAQPGYTALWFYGEDGEEKEMIDRHPIIAWQLDLELGFHIAITLWNSPGDDPMPAILCPDGRVIEPGSMTHPNEESWVKDQRRAAEKEAKRKQRIASAATASSTH